MAWYLNVLGNTNRRVDLVCPAPTSDAGRPLQIEYEYRFVLKVTSTDLPIAASNTTTGDLIFINSFDVLEYRTGTQTNTPLTGVDTSVFNEYRIYCTFDGSTRRRQIFVNGVQVGNHDGLAVLGGNNIASLFTVGNSTRAGGLRFWEYIDHVTPANNRFFDADASNGAGSVLPETSGNGVNGTLVSFQPDPWIFEPTGGAVESTVSATWPLFQAQASQSSAAPITEADIAAQWPIFGVSVSQGAQVPDIDSTIAAAWPLFSVQASQSSDLPQYQASIATTWPMFSASVSQQSEVPQYSSDVAVAWPLFTVTANQESQLPEGATSIAVTWPLFGVDASQQSTTPEFDSAIAATWPLFQVSASQQQELPSGATAIAIEWPLFGAQASQQSTIPEFTATVAATWPLFSVSILAGEFEFFASPQARVDIPNLSRRVDIPSLSRRIDI